MSTGQHGPDPAHILELGFGFWASKVLLSAVEMGVFTVLTEGPLTAEDLRTRLGLHPRAARDFLDALVAMKLLAREGGLYSNTPDSALFLDRNKPSYVGGILEMANARLWSFWGNLSEGLRTGEPQNESKHGVNIFDELYADEDLLSSFVRGMTGLSLGPARAMAAKFPWPEYGSVVDVGTAQGALPVQLALAHEHLTGGGFDLPVIRNTFEEYVRSHGLHERLAFHPGDFFNDDLPSSDVLVMGHILHDWGIEEKMALLDNAYRALPKGGSLIVYESLIDDERRENTFGLLMSLNMLIETKAGFDYSAADCFGWMREVGFTEMRSEHLVGPDAMVIAVKG